MFYLIYISTAMRPMAQKDLIDILTKSRDNNLSLNVTGLLLYAEGTFIQALEGLEENVMAVYQDIIQDERHKNIIKLVSGPITKRTFPNWAMGFAALAPDKLKELEGYINPDSGIFDEQTSQHPSIMILRSFAESNRLTSNL